MFPLQVGICYMYILPYNTLKIKISDQIIKKFRITMARICPRLVCFGHYHYGYLKLENLPLYPTEILTSWSLDRYGIGSVLDKG